MINKQSLWFLTLFSIIIVLSVYYIALPNNTLATISEIESDKETIYIDEVDTLAALRIENEEEIESTLNELQSVLLNEKSSLEEKNTAYESIQDINTNKGKCESIEKLISDNFDFDSFVKIKDDNISITISNKKHDKELANNIIRLIQKEYTNKMYITVKFQ